MPRRPLVPLAALLTLALTACDARYPPMPEMWADPGIAPHQKRSDLPPATDEGATPDGSLLQSYADRKPRPEAELATWMLPFQAKTMIVELLIAAAKDDPERMQVLLADNARWGLPDRRELRARPISTEKDPWGIEFLTAFRNATSRFGEKASFSCTPLQPGWQTFAASGAEPVWCSYTSTDGFDIIGFRLIMVGGLLKTDYIGFFPTRQSMAIRVPEAGDPPPLTPYPKRPVDLTLPELMPDGSNPVVEKRRGEPRSDEPIPVPGH
jgi:hypothetical protein